MTNKFLETYNFTRQFLRKFPYYLTGVFPFIYNFKNRNCYENLSYNQLLRKKKSDVVFICGTGNSINNIKKKTWRIMEKYDIISFRDFPRKEGVKVDYHISGEIDNSKNYAQIINKNLNYKYTYLIIQDGFRAIKGNTLIGKKLLNLNFKIFRYKRKNIDKMMNFSKKFNEGIVHSFNSLISVINIAFIMGWKKIILVGIDMDTHKYFYHKSNKVRDVEKKGITPTSSYTNRDKTLLLISLWNKRFQKKGISLFIYNKNSYLKKTLPLFNWSILPK